MILMTIEMEKWSAFLKVEKPGQFNLRIGTLDQSSTGTDILREALIFICKHLKMHVLRDENINDEGYAGIIIKPEPTTDNLMTLVTTLVPYVTMICADCGTPLISKMVGGNIEVKCCENCLEQVVHENVGSLKLRIESAMNQFVSSIQ